jgi:RecA/RadA recombinase
MAKKWMEMLTKGRAQVASETTLHQRAILTSPSLNWALSGGLVYGNTTCYYGPEQSGKSLLTMIGAAAIHRDDPDAIVVLTSAEFRKPSKDKLVALGVDPDRLVVRQYNTIHDIFDWIASPDEKFKLSDGSTAPGLLWMLKEGAPIKGLITDSIKAIRGPREIGSDSAEDNVMGDLSKFLNPALRKILPVIRDYGILNQFVQQVNMNMNPDEVKYQNKKYTLPSGMSLRHFCETMCLVERVERKDAKLFDEGKSGVRDTATLQVGHTVRVKVEKANMDTPFREAEFHLHYNRGVVDVGHEVAQLAMNMGAIVHPKNDKGSDIVNQWKFGDKKWIGFDACVAELEENPELRRQVMAAVYEIQK